MNFMEKAFLGDLNQIPISQKFKFLFFIRFLILLQVPSTFALNYNQLDFLMNFQILNQKVYYQSQTKLLMFNILKGLFFVKLDTKADYGTNLLSTLLNFNLILLNLHL